MSPDTLILGGGVIGLTAAYYLAKQGGRVAVLDKGDMGQEASWAGAGILPPGNLQHARSPFDRLRALSCELFALLSAELLDTTGIDNGYLRSGGIAFPDDRHPASVEEWQGEGIAAQALDERSLRELEPAVRTGLGPAVYLPEMAQVRNPRHLKALIAGCTRLGVSLNPGCAALGWETRGDRVVAARTAQGTFAAEKFLIAAGAWSSPLLQQFHMWLAVRPVRGQIALLHPTPPILRHILMLGSRYLVPRADGRILVGSTEELAGFDKRTTAEGQAGLLTLACHCVPALAEAEVEKSWAGLRPGSPDGLPYLGPVPGVENLFVAAGHFRAGIQLSTGTAQMMKEYLLEQPLTIPGKPFEVNRGTASTVSRDAVAERVPAPVN